MGPDELADLLDRPETHRTILGGYQGPYSLGVTRSPDPGGGFCFLLRVADQDPGRFPRVVEIDGCQIPVIVKLNFIKPKPL